MGRHDEEADYQAAVARIKAKFRKVAKRERALLAQEMTPEAKARQRISFAYGNANISNPNVTREMVERAAEKMKEEG